MKLKLLSKILLFVIIFTLTGVSILPRPVLAQETFPEMDIDEAVTKGMVTADVRASGNSYYGPGTLNATLTNTSEQPLAVIIPQGLRFRSLDTTYQDEIVAVIERVDLQPGETQTVPLTSFCGNAHRAAPAPDNAYAIGEMETPRLRNLLRGIEQENLQNDIQGQWAVWGQTDDVPIPSLPDFNDVTTFLDGLGSNGVVRQVANNAPFMDGALLQGLMWQSLLKTLLPWLLLALALLLLALFLWWRLRQPSVQAALAPPRRANNYQKVEKPTVVKKPQGQSITQGYDSQKRGEK